MAYTTGDLVTKVQNRIRDPGYSTSEIKQYLTDAARDAYNEYPSLPIWRTSVDTTVTSGNSDIMTGNGLPNNFSMADYLIDTTNGQELAIPYIDQKDLDGLYPDGSDQTRYQNGQPEYWYSDGDTIRIFPAPAGAYTLRLHYYKSPSELSDDASVPDIPSSFEELLVVGAGYRVLQAKGSYDEAGILQNKYDEILQKLVDKAIRQPTIHIMRTNRGMLSTYTPLDSYRHRIP